MWRRLLETLSETNLWAFACYNSNINKERNGRLVSLLTVLPLFLLQYGVVSKPNVCQVPAIFSVVSFLNQPTIFTNNKFFNFILFILSWTSCMQHIFSFGYVSTDGSGMSCLLGPMPMIFILEDRVWQEVERRYVALSECGPLAENSAEKLIRGQLSNTG